MMLYGTISSTPSEDRYTLTASLLADVTAAQVLLLQQRLVARSPAGVTPQICMPTDPSVGAIVTTTWPAPVNALPPQTVPILDSLNPTFTLDTADTALLTAMCLTRWHTSIAKCSAAVVSSMVHAVRHGCRLQIAPQYAN